MSETFRGKTLEDALANASEKLGVPTGLLAVEIIDEGRMGFWGIGSAPVIIMVSNANQIAQLLKDFEQNAEQESALDSFASDTLGLDDHYFDKIERDDIYCGSGRFYCSRCLGIKSISKAGDEVIKRLPKSVPLAVWRMLPAGRKLTPAHFQSISPAATGRDSTSGGWSIFGSDSNGQTAKGFTPEDDDNSGNDFHYGFQGAKEAINDLQRAGLMLRGVRITQTCDSCLQTHNGMYQAGANPVGSSLSKGLVLEERVVGALRRIGWEVEDTPLSADGGIDFIARRTDAIGVQTVLVGQCKNWDSPVGVAVVREIIGVASGLAHGQAVIVAVRGLTRAAELLAGERSVLVWDETQVLWLEDQARAIGR